MLACCYLFLGVTSVYADCLDDAALYHGVNPSLVRAIASVESGFSSSAVNLNRNGTEDIGLMQINSSWLPTLASYGIRRAALFDGCVNAYVGTWILAQNISRMGLTWDAVGAYNAASRPLRIRYAKRVYARLLRVSFDGSPLTPAPPTLKHGPRMSVDSPLALPKQAASFIPSRSANSYRNDGAASAAPVAPTALAQDQESQ